MIGKDGKWRFNTSICEETNVWFGGFISVVQDMEATRYNFFLDEMIKRGSAVEVQRTLSVDYPYGNFVSY